MTARPRPLPLVALLAALAACDGDAPGAPPAAPSCAGDDRAPVPDENGGVRCIEVGASPAVAAGAFADADFAGAALAPPVAHVRAAAAPGGDGTAGRPFATLADALRSGAATVLLARGTYALSEPVALDRPLALVGAGAGATVLRAPDAGPAFRARGAAVTVARLSVTGSATTSAPVVDVADGATATLRHVRVDGGAGGARVSGAATQASFERVTVAGARAAGVSVEDGARARLVGVAVRDGAGLGVIAGASGPGAASGRVLLRESWVARNGAEGVSLTGDASGATGFATCDDALTAARGALDCVALTAVQANTGTGLYASGPRRVIGRADLVSGTRARGGAPSGDGLFVGAGASVELDRGVVGDARMGHGTWWVANARAGVLVSGAGASARIQGAAVRDNAGPGVFVQAGATLDGLLYSAVERNGGVGLGAGEGASLGEILCDHFLATRPAELATTLGRVSLADGVSVHRAAVRAMTGCELSSNARFGLVLNAASGAFTRNRGQDNLYGLGNYAPAGAAVDDVAAIRGRAAPPAALPAFAVAP